MSDQLAPDARQPLDAETADVVRVVAAQAGARADQFAVVLEDGAADELPDPQRCTAREELREAHLARLADQRPSPDAPHPRGRRARIVFS